MRELLKYILLFFFLLIGLSLSAQTSYGGTPPSWNAPKSKLKSHSELKSHVISNPFTVQQLIEDEERSEDMPERVGINLATRLSVAEDGEWDILPSGERICRLKIESNGALALSLYYSNFEIPQASQLYIYNGDHSHLLGAYTSETNPQGGAFATEFVAGDNLILEYVDNSSGELPKINIEKICYGYKNLKVSSIDKLRCMVDVVCSEGEDWINEKDGVVKMVTVIGNYSYLCSATLLNNTSEDCTPYIYTAFHCLEGDGTIASAIDLKKTIFYFNYEAVECGSDEIKDTETIVGCTLLEGKSLASSDGLDQALLLISSDIPTSLVPYFNGWDRGITPPQRGVSIHHPKGAVKKISTYISQATSGTWPSISLGGVNAHWVVQFTRTANGHSATEGGSSGSPLFNQNKLVVGALTGGNSSCENPQGSNYYGKLQRFWSYISKYLDPINSGTTSLQGKWKGEIIASPKGLNAKLSEDATKVELTWLPLSNTPSNYIVYRNGVIVGHPTSNSFTDENIYTGKHTYQVSAYYDDLKSETAKSNQSVVSKSPVVAPIIDTVARASENSVILDWSMPQSEQTIFWGSGLSTLKLSTNLSCPVYFGQKWGEEDLSGLEGYVIKRVKTVCLADVNYTLYIRQGTNIYTQSLPVVPFDKEVEIVLDKEFVVGVSAPLYCSLRVNSGEGYLVATDSDKIVEGKGNIVSVDGYEWHNLDTKGNISIKAILCPPRNGVKEVVSVSDFEDMVISSSVPVAYSQPDKFRLYRNGELLTTMSGLTTRYTDRNMVKGQTYEYLLEALYKDGEVCASLPYSYYLNDKSFTAQIESVEVNGQLLKEERGGVYNYSATCANDLAEIIVTAKDNGVVMINGAEGELYNENISFGGKYRLPVTIISESGESRAEYELSLYKLPSDILIKRWDDVLTIMNNPDNNGSLSFVGYEWYLNDERLPDTEPYITIPKGVGSDDIFSVKVVTEEGVELKSCGVSFDSVESEVFLYPNAVERGGELTLTIIAPQSSVVTATLAHLTGQIQPLTLSVGENIVKAPQVSGTYIINVTLSNGVAKNLKFIVR